MASAQRTVSAYFARLEAIFSLRFSNSLLARARIPVARLRIYSKVQPDTIKSVPLRVSRV